MENIILVGFGGHAKSVADCIEREKRFRIIGFTDVKKQESYRDYPYLGDDDQLEGLYKNGVRNAFVSLGYMGNGNVRSKIYERLKKIGFVLPSVVDPSAIVSVDVQVGEGVLIGKRAIVNPGSIIRKMCIINTGALVEHESYIDDFSHIAVNATLCGGVTIGSHSFIGANATIIQSISVGSNCIIGAGSVVLRNVENTEKVYGIVKKHP